MIDRVPSLAQLIKTLQQIPYLASKNIYQLTTYFLQLDPDKLEHICAVLLKARAQVQPCAVCYVWKESEGICSFCDASDRDKDIICVVETWQELLTIEKTGGYTGVYHVLGGVISPLDGIGPEDLAIMPLLKRITNATKEIILATNQTPEGEATAAYIARKLSETNIAVSCLARGIPVGSSLAFMDRLTIYKALADRRPF